MTVAGTNAFAAPRELVRSVATWLLHDFDPAATYAEQPGAITGDPEIHGSVQLTHAWCIGRLLMKQARRKRMSLHQGLITVTLAKRDRAWLIKNLPKRAMPEHEVLRGSAVRFRDLLNALARRHRGRPQLSAADRADRISRQSEYSGAYWYKLEHQRRLEDEAAERRRLWIEFYRSTGRNSHLLSNGDSDFERWLDTRAQNLPNKV